jgi:hypothetical protein
MACDNLPLLAPTGTSITLLATTNVLQLHQSTEIVANLIEGGQDGFGAGTPVHNGTLVTFTTSLGRLEPTEAKTDNGQARVRLIADDRSGTATVIAFSGAATQSLLISIGSASAARIVLTANPQALPAGGGATAISARVEDLEGNGIDGVLVTFTATAGTLSATAVPTTASGFASSTLSTTASATVTASLGGALATTVDVSVAPPARSPS